LLKLVLFSSQGDSLREVQDEAIGRMGWFR